MTTATRTRVSSWNASPTATDWQGWGQDFEAMIQAAGLVKTGDTGQIDWTAQAVPTADLNNSIRGYAMYRFADALQATSPIFIKFEFVAAAYPVGNLWGWSWRVQFGTATNGAGALATNFSGNVYMTSGQVYHDNPSYDFNARTWYAAHGPGYFSLVTHARPNGIRSVYNQGALVIERTTDSTGAPDGAGIIATHSGPSGTTGTTSTTITCVLVPARAATAVTWHGGGRLVIMPWITTGALGNDIYLAPGVGDLPEPKGQLLGTLGYVNSDLAQFTAITVPLYGASRTFMPIGTQMAANVGIASAGSSTWSLLVRYE